MKHKSIIGIDFDNTLIGYDDVFFNRALESALIDSTTGKNKKEVRDKVRLLPDGEVSWQKLQAFVYTQGMTQAHLIQGADDFLKTCLQKKIKVVVVSHKTEYAPYDPLRINLRETALNWMKQKQFFVELGLEPKDIYFESTREQKIDRLKVLGCQHFIDDLEEVFQEESFPQRVEKILLGESQGSGIKAFKSWTGIHEYFFS